MVDPAEERGASTNRLFSRREALGLIGGAVAGLSLIGASGAVALPTFGPSTSGAASGTATGKVTQDMLGIQLWTCLAEYLADTPHAFASIAAIGYKYVEYAAGYGNDPASGKPTGDPKTLRKALDDNGLWCIGGHGTSPWPYNDSAWKQYVSENLVIGSRYLGSNVNLPTTKSDCQRYVADVHKAHDVARRMGFKGFLYNHLEKASWVKLDGKGNTWSVEYILEHTSPDVWNAEIDTAHAIYALGTVDAVSNMIRKHPGRLPFVHMKDSFAPFRLPDGTLLGTPVNSSPFGGGDFGRPSAQDPQGRPHDGFQTLLTAVRETQDWKHVRLMAEADGSQATCYDYAIPAYQGLNGLTFPYRPHR
jgi:sugar phosphate isomerase/epimerase